MNKKGTTLRVVCRVSHAVLNNCNYDLVCKANSDDLLNSIQQIGWVNINKIAAGKTSPKDLTPKFNIWKDVLKEQIVTYNPEVIICGNTLQYFDNEKYMDFRSNTGVKKPVGMGNFHYFCFSDRLYINAYHPSKLFLNEREYINKYSTHIVTGKVITEKTDRFQPSSVSELPKTTFIILWGRKTRTFWIFFDPSPSDISSGLYLYYCNYGGQYGSKIRTNH